MAVLGLADGLVDRPRTALRLGAAATHGIVVIILARIAAAASARSAAMDLARFGIEGGALSPLALLVLVSRSISHRRLSMPSP